jgi:DNA-3-methyladenine glycosylase II
MSLHLDTNAALAHFKAADPKLARLLGEALASPAPLVLPRRKPPRFYFASVARSIVSQQISVKAAEAVHARLVARLGSVTPKTVRRASVAELCACGLSGQKARYLKVNASSWDDFPAAALCRLDDEGVIRTLTSLHGVGRWTAEMFLMFTLARPDVFSFGDLGLMKSLEAHYGVRPRHTRKLQALVARWSPHRTLAALTLWWHKDSGPVEL